MKKFVIVCCVLLVAMALVTGSIAYFTDSVESKNNVIASGTLDIEQQEYERQKENGAFVQDAESKYILQPYTQNQPVYPTSITSETLADKRGSYDISYTSDVPGYAGTVSLFDGSIPGFIDKIVPVENVGTLICYVRTFVAVPAYDDADGNGIPWIHLDLNQEAYEADKPCWDWESPIRAQIDGKNYDIYKGTYQKQLQPGEFAPPSLLGFYMDGNVSNDGDSLIYKAADGKKYSLMSTGDSWNVLVKSEASQAIVFDGVENALTVTFEGDGIENYHPWMNEKP